MTLKFLIYKIVSCGWTKHVKPVFYRLINVLLFRLAGVRFGKKFKVFNKIYLDVNISSQIYIGDDFLISSDDNINPLCPNRCSCFFVENDAVLKIGNSVGMSSPTIWAANRIEIGNRVNVGAGCIIMDTDCHSLDCRIRALRDLPKDCHQMAKTKPVVIEDDVWIGVNSIILKGVTVGARSVVAAGSVVTKDVPADCIVAGNPAEVVRHSI